MIDIHLYGELRRYAKETGAQSESVIRLSAEPADTVRSVLRRVGISPNEVCHVFLNGTLLFTRNSMAPWLQYQETKAGGIDAPLVDGDRLGLFARDMALLVV